jgi:hypothetical protein
MRQKSSTLWLRRPRVQYWLQVARWSILILLVFELWIRIFIVSSPPREYKPEWGIIPVENSHSFQGLEGYAVLHYFANGEVQTPNRDGISIVVLGDSTTLAAQVDPDSNYVSLTEVALRERGYQVDLHNLGRSARLIPDHVYMAPAVKATYAPKYLIVQVSPDSFTLAYDRANENYFIDQGGGKLVLMHQVPSSKGDLAYRNFITISGLLDHLDFRIWFSVQEIKKKYAGSVTETDNVALRNVNANPESPDRIGQEDVNRQYRNQVFSQVQALKDAYPDSRIIFSVIFSAPKIDPDPNSGIIWARPGDTYLVDLLKKIDGIDVVSTQKVFQEFYKKYKVLPRGTFNSAFNFGHLNNYGHLAVAQALTNAMQEILK